MSSKLTSTYDSNQYDSPPSVMYGPGVFDNLRELFEKSMAPTGIHDINKTYYGFKSVRVIEPPCINCQKKGVACVKYASSRSTRCQFCNLGKKTALRPTIVTGSRMRGFQQLNNTKNSWANIGGPILPQGKPIGVAPEVPILVTRKDGRLGKLMINIVVKDDVDTDSEGSDEIDG
ncbi:hypothetical protein O181_016964 [Austropuccinia psidii MF-1]|uniref:Uncharacterized protein n=1 Tax=Austropuccinia psidii MF-1 TaxID=1389203 RepID=A0A9Q3GSB5_9BASI|nr:hypothetical protein [Austropuccinia psidii MF-1]